MLLVGTQFIASAASNPTPGLSPNSGRGARSIPQAETVFVGTRFIASADRYAPRPWAEERTCLGKGLKSREFIVHTGSDQANRV